MLGRLTRIVLAFATALTLTGQVEAATAHCARLAKAVEMAVAPVKAETAKADAPSCHDMQKAAEPASHHLARQKPTDPSRCECIAVLSECAPIQISTGSTRIAPYAWAPPEAEAFASTEPAPALRPPRA